MEKLVKCKTCGAEIARTAKVCPSCGAKNKPPVYNRVWFWLLLGFAAMILMGTILGAATSSAVETAGAGSTGTQTSQSTAVSSGNPEVPTTDDSFAGECGISASAEMGTSIIGYPELHISIQNTTSKEISAIQFYAVPYDVYGDEIRGWTSQNKLYTDTAISAGGSNSISYQFIEDSVKMVDLYVYSVYFSDGTEWGDKDATKSKILENGAKIEVAPES